MSNVKLAGNVSGTGSVTIASPNTNSDISISLPTVTGGSFIVSDSSGNVGIGTSSPTNALQIVGTAKASSQLYVGSNSDDNYSGGVQNLSNSSRSISIQADPTNSGASTILTFGVDGTERMRIDSSGNVGIGTSSPSAQLHVKNAGGNSISILGQYGSGTIAQIGAYANQVDIKAYNGTNDVMTFTTGASERMRIDSSGNVGIGNTAANVNDQVGAVRPLLVSKSDTSTTIAGSQANIVIGNAATTTSNTSQISFAALTGANTTYFASAAINCVFGARTNGQYPTGQLVFSTSTSLNSAPTEKMRINAGGQLFTTIDGTSSVMADYGCRAWVNFNGTGTVAIRGSGNVSSITDNGTGDYTVNLTTAMPDANYSTNVNVSNASGTSSWGMVNINTQSGGSGVAPTTTAFRFVCIVYNASAYLDTNYISAAIFR